MKIIWLRPAYHRIAHGFNALDLDAGFERIEPVASCGRSLVGDLAEDGYAQRCEPCTRAAAFLTDNS